ncbi:Modification methylase MthTI [uncultured archaeon]|nr:Modification methylase MthTI [uncultured archaeon]
MPGRQDEGKGGHEGPNSYLKPVENNSDGAGVVKETYGHSAIIRKRLNLDGEIQSFTEQNMYYWGGEPKLFEAKEPADPTKLTAIEMFCGLGGTSLGFEMAGFQTILGVDIHAPSIETFRNSHVHAAAILGDIHKIVHLNKDNDDNLIVRAVRGRIGKKRPDIMLAGVPCQGFSLANKKRNHLDARNYNFLYFVEMVKVLKPRAVLIENVSGLKSMKNGEFAENIISALEAAGYRSHSQMLNAIEFGVPQKRQRIFFLGTESKSRIPFPKPTVRQKPITVFDAISDLPSIERGGGADEYSEPPKTTYQKLMRGNEKTLRNHEAPSHPDEVVEKIRNTIPGEPMYPRYKQRIRLSWDAPSPTQVSGGIRPQFQFGHPRDARGLTVRERCRLQSIPDFVEVYGGVVQGRVQTGNAVPPLLAKAVAEQILEHLSSPIKVKYLSSVANR